MKGVLFAAFIILFVSISSYSVKPLCSVSDKSSITTPIEISDTSLAKSFFNVGNNFLKELKYDSAIVYLDKAKMIYEKENLWESSFNCVNTIASILREKGEIDSSIVVLENILGSEIKKYGKDNLVYAKTINLLGYSYMIKSNLQKALELAEESLVIQLKNKSYEEAADTYYLLGIIYLKKSELDISLKNLTLGLNNCNTETQTILISNIYNTIGQVYSDKKYSDKAIEYYKLSLELKLKELGELNPETSVIYNNLAAEYFYIEDNETAIEYYLKALSIDLQIRDAGDYVIGLRYNNIAMAYRVMDNFGEAVKYGELAKNILINKLGEKHPNVGAVINNTGRIYSDMKEFDKAIGLYQTALTIWEEKFGENHPLVAQAFSNIGEALGNKGDYFPAIELLNKSLSIRLSVLGEKHPKVSESYERMGKVYLQMQNYDSALCFYRKSIISLTEGFQDSSIYVNPEPDKILWNHDLLNTLMLKGDAFALRYSQSSNLNDLLSAYSAFQLSSRLVNNVRHSFKAEGSKLSFSGKAFSIYERGINISLQLFNLTKNDMYKQAAFKFAEESKAGLLFDAVSEVKARNFSGISDTLLEQEKDLRIDLAYFDTQILNEKQKKLPSPEKISELKDKYFSLHTQYLSLLESLEKNYPSYYQLKYKEKNVTVENLQMLLDDQSIIIEYFLGDSTFSIFTISRNSFDVVTIKSDTSITEIVRQLRQSLQNLEFNNYISSASALYRILIKPVEDKIFEAKNLFIVPDGTLFYLPFEALLSGNIEMNEEINFTELPYLVKAFNISYLFSTAFLQKEAKRLESKLSFAGFAPVFADENSQSENKTIDDLTAQLKRAVEINDKTYSELPESKREVEGILTLFQKKNLICMNFISEDAKEDVLKSDSMYSFSFVHIASHGFINEDKPKFSGIIFTDKNNPPDEDGILYSDEIYNLHLNADLVVLSACETGLGKIVKGEGLIGLTRGFVYSGARNILVSLWQVADKSTSELMIEFYKNVLDGKSYSSSLREAKLKLIKDGAYSYPLEWSPFVLIGN